MRGMGEMNELTLGLHEPKLSGANIAVDTLGFGSASSSKQGHKPQEANYTDEGKGLY